MIYVNNVKCKKKSKKLYMTFPVRSTILIRSRNCFHPFKIKVYSSFHTDCKRISNRATSLKKSLTLTDDNMNDNTHIRLGTKLNKRSMISKHYPLLATKLCILFRSKLMFKVSQKCFKMELDVMS